MGQYVVAVSIDKVQSFLYYVLHASEQEKQSNSGTLKTIIESSRLISDQFYQDIGVEEGSGPFNGHIDKELLKCSGMCVFTTSLSEEQIINNLDALFRSYYMKLSGKLLLKYVFFKKTELKSDSDLLAIKECKNRLRQTNCLNSIIERNREVLFTFHAVPQDDQERDVLMQQSFSEKFPDFSNTINDLYSESEAVNDNHFRVAVIKADLDGMGDIFNSLNSYETYKQVSELLSEYISMEKLHDQVIRYQKKDNTFKLYPLYIAGDDIFFAVPGSKLIDGVNLCQSILNQINTRLEQINSMEGTKLKPLSMSIGIDFTFNREPIRYYYERVQEQLDLAKAEGLCFTEHIYDLSCMKISINQFQMYRYRLPEVTPNSPQERKAFEAYEKEFKTKNENKQQWHHFVSQVKRLQYAMNEGYAAHHFFYGLLDKITNREIKSNAVKYSNAVLYHMIPQHLNSNNQKLREAELLVLESVLKQVIVSNATGREGRLCFDENQQMRLENYVRLLLLFSDPRFQMNDEASENNLGQNDIKRIRSTLFNKTLRYLVDNNLDVKSSGLRDIFVSKSEYDKPSQNMGSKWGQKGGSRKNNKVEVYRTLNLSSSLLHRLKSVTGVERMAEMIEAVNPQTLEMIKDREEQCKAEHKAPPGLYFDKLAFIRMARRSGSWNSDYIDSLLIFYQLREQLIGLKVHPAYQAKRRTTDRRKTGGRGR
ncbi:hypothetical protein [Paenibacillus sp. JJ-223]|uniref:Cas10/Cmr2 second palm domain-containing protein n=1 Tax=Paenibacillus sp. JJ-223 TaxID=2905647 RepID=UPI001F2FCE6D|nr:hypothetical protein [Paenibacillus sp. JJ-223]CAH1219100.1 hypothetical protein PAECIP111890_04851 [Paenibacillus sp. JJ-223]